MALVLTEEQRMLKDSAREYLKDKSPVSALRMLRDTQDKKGFNPTVWKEMAGMGWTSLTIEEEYGGLDFGFVGLGQVLEEMGRTLTASPMLSTVLLGANLISHAGNEAQKKQIIPPITEGNILVSLAFEEGNRHRLLPQSTTAEPKGDSYVLNGEKVFVLDGHIADYLIVMARTSGQKNEREGLSLFLVDSSLEGISRQRSYMMDSRNAANIKFENLHVDASSLLGPNGQAMDLLEPILDRARIGLSAEMLGMMAEAFERSINYLKERQQFGVLIGSFQALQHRAAQMFCEIELCRSLVLNALQAIDQGVPNLAEIASMTKAKVNETLRLVTNEGIQLFGGIGMTDDEEIGFFLKRARVAQQTLGDASFHLNRYAKINQY